MLRVNAAASEVTINGASPTHREGPAEGSEADVVMALNHYHGQSYDGLCHLLLRTDSGAAEQGGDAERAVSGLGSTLSDTELLRGELPNPLARCSGLAA